MITNKGKRAILIVFAFSGSYLITYLLDPYSDYWNGYFSRPFKFIFFEWSLSIAFCTVISELTLYLDRILNKKMHWTVRPLNRLLVQSVIQIVGVLVVIAILHFIVAYLYDVRPSTPTISEIKGAVQWTVATVLVALMISAVNTGNYLIVNWKATALEAAEHQIKAAQHKQAAAEAELHALKQQLDTHFVFNNLSVLSELILEDQQLGYKYAENFTKVYRYLLVNAKKVNARYS